MMKVSYIMHVEIAVFFFIKSSFLIIFVAIVTRPLSAKYVAELWTSLIYTGPEQNT